MATIFTDYRNYSRFYLSWDVAQQDIANNRSLINWTAGVQGQPGYTAYWYSNAIRLNSVYIDGQGNLASGTWSNITLPNGATVPLRSGSVWVGHNSDGTKSFGASVSGWFYANGDVSASGAWGIPTIPRNSQVTTNSGSYTLGNPVSIYTNRKSGSFTHAITIKKDNSGGQVLKVFTDVADAVTWTPTSAEITTMQNLIPNSNTLNLYIEQYNYQVGQSSSVVVTLNLTDANPIFSTFTYRDSNETAVAITGNDQILVKGKSILETTITSANKMQAVKGASPSQYSIVYDGVTLQKPFQSSGDIIGTISQVNTTGQRTVLVTATDSRNNNTSASKQVTVYDYSAPTIESTIIRENNFGSDTTVHLNGVLSPLVIDGSAKNSLTTGSLKYRYREDTGSFGAWTTRSFMVTDNTWEIATDFVISLDNTKKYVFEFQISDRFGTTTTTSSVDVGKPIVFIGEKDGTPALGIGKMPVDGALDVVGDIYSNGLKVPSGSWTELNRLVTQVTPTGSTLTFPAHKYLKISVFSRQVSPPGSAQYMLKMQVNGVTSTTYNRAIQRILSNGTTAGAGDDANYLMAGISRSPGQQSLMEYTVNGNIGGITQTIGYWTMTSEDTDWYAAHGRYRISSSDPITSIKLFVDSIPYDVELIVYGHN